MGGGEGGWGGVEGVGGGITHPVDTSGLAVGHRSTHMSLKAHFKVKVASTLGSVPMPPY